MGGFYSMMSDCFKKRDIEKPILNIEGIYDDNNVLTKLSDVIDNRKVQWSTYDSISEQEYLRMISESKNLRKKYKDNCS